MSHSMCRVTDIAGTGPTAQTDTVRSGIRLQRVMSTMAAAEYLLVRDIAPATVRRVLTEGGRASDSPH